MKVLVFGASGMVGQGVVRECVRAIDVTEVVAVGRAPSGLPADPKFREIVHADLSDVTAIDDQLAGFDACFFCLGVTSAGLDEAAYTRVTYDFTLAPARALARHSPGITFIYVSGAGTDSTEKGRSMWARVKGRTENALLALFPNAYMFRPGGIQPRHGARSKTRSYRIAYAIAWPLLPLLKLVGAITTTERVGLAMLNVARRGADTKLLGTRDINRLAT
jgi:uncharacterized protein YbjT (DUF2867 family)